MMSISLLPPPFEWCAVPAGTVTLEHIGPFRVAAFDISKYPITNGQFEAFVQAGNGYADQGWWDFSRKARAWRAQNEARPTAFPGDDLPRTNVSWYEALAFCRWLSAASGENVGLPTEQEWQRAAQGDDGRGYPWGNEYDIARCNTSESGIKVATPVTKYPQGASPYGVMDLSGNVAEWCLNAYNVPGDTDIVTFNGGEARAARGGSWGLNRFNALATFRSYNPPGERFDYQGFRVVRRL